MRKLGVARLESESVQFPQRRADDLLPTLAFEFLSPSTARSSAPSDVCHGVPSEKILMNVRGASQTSNRQSTGCVRKCLLFMVHTSRRMYTRENPMYTLSAGRMDGFTYRATLARTPTVDGFRRPELC